METVLELQGVTVRRDGKALIEDVDFRTEPGQHWAVLGANGAGKTTLLQVILGYLWPTVGTVSVLGERLGRTDVRELRKRIGFVSSNMDARIEPSSKAQDVVASGLFASYELFEKVDPRELDRAAALLDEFGLGRKASQPYRTLSQGERQKTMIARALVAEPQLLILDEPCTGLDFPSRESVLEIIAGLTGRAKGPQILYVTHYPNEIVSELDHALVLRAARIVAVGRKRDTLTDEVLSRAYDLPVEVSWHDGQPFVRVRKSGK